MRAPSPGEPPSPRRGAPEAAALHIGISGWNYAPWKNDFYAGVPRRQWLAHYATRFDSVEVNASFYRSVRAETYAAWAAATPTTFRFAIKGHRFVTHQLRLADAAEPIARQRDSAAALGTRLAAVLWQLPRSATKDIARLKAFLAALRAWPEMRHVIEFRHASWFDAETASCLAAHRVASAISDAASWPLWDAVTTDLVYVRLHGRRRTYISPYGETALAQWAERVRGWRREGRTVHVYFDNTMEGAAPNDAARFRALLAGARPSPALATAAHR